MADLENYQVTIAAGQSLSPIVKMGFKVLVGLSFDANWTSPTGGCTFQMSPDGVNFSEMYDGSAGTAIAVPAAVAKAGQFATMPNLAQWAGTNMIKIRSGTAAAPVNQTNATTVTIFVRTVAF